MSFCAVDFLFAATLIITLFFDQLCIIIIISIILATVRSGLHY